jgi:hypothetical protein
MKRYGQCVWIQSHVVQAGKFRRTSAAARRAGFQPAVSPISNRRRGERSKAAGATRNIRRLEAPRYSSFETCATAKQLACSSENGWRHGSRGFYHLLSGNSSYHHMRVNPSMG